MLLDLNHEWFLAINASSQPSAVAAALAEIAAKWLIYAAAALPPALWVWGRRSGRGPVIATAAGVGIALVANQLLGLLWYEPRPFMIGLGHTLVPHAVENSFPSDHATFLWSLGLALIATGASRLWGWTVCLIGLLVAWARIYLGLHFPIDMAASLLVGLAAAAAARMALPTIERWVLPWIDWTYETVLRILHLPTAFFPRAAGPQRDPASRPGPRAAAPGIRSR